ncbi:hypothetical protein DIPPA_05187 [Diplonema papillatum]|nr:hypothetical protein DIPPA_05187 [Diplonema papillatum]
MPKRKRDPSEKSSEDTSSDESTASSGSLLPKRSKKKYKKTWDDFLAYIRKHCSYPKSETTTRKTSEAQYTSYIKELKERGLAPTTIWTYFSVLCTQHTLLHGENPAKQHPRLAQRLKTYSKDHVSKKATPPNGCCLFLPFPTPTARKTVEGH